MTNGAPSLNPTESAELAGALFDDVLTPLANAKREAGAEPYFALGRDDGLASYFVRPAVTSMRPADFEFPGDGGSEGLIEALVAHWTREGEAELAATALLALDLTEASLKVRTGPPGDDERDLSAPVWAGVLPLRTAVGEPEPCPLLSPDTPVPARVRDRAV